MTSDNYDILLNVFKAIDVDNSGHITPDELTMAFNDAAMPLAGSEISALVAKFDYLKTGKINYTDFLAATVNLK